jgi:hypothetical protein
VLSRVQSFRHSSYPPRELEPAAAPPARCHPSDSSDGSSSNNRASTSSAAHFRKAFTIPTRLVVCGETTPKDDGRRSRMLLRGISCRSLRTSTIPHVRILTRGQGFCMLWIQCSSQVRIRPQRVVRQSKADQMCIVIISEFRRPLFHSSSFPLPLFISLCDVGRAITECINLF